MNTTSAPRTHSLTERASAAPSAVSLARLGEGRGEEDYMALIKLMEKQSGIAG